MIYSSIRLGFVFLFTSQLALAQQKADDTAGPQAQIAPTEQSAKPSALSSENRKIKVNSKKYLRIDYTSKAWNKSSTAIDSSVIFIRDGITGKIAKVEMTETGPDTNQFTGNFNLRFEDSGDTATETSPELYVVPPKLASDLSKIEAMIEDGSIIRKPYFFRSERNQQIISVYDSKEQAFEAYNEFLKTGPNKQAVDRGALEAKRLADAATEKLKLEQAALDRVKLAELEAKRQADLKEQAAKMDAAERARRKQEAKTLAEQAMAHFNKEEYKDAEKKFARAIELDPENNQYNFQHGVSLYRTEQYNKSLVALGMATDPKVNATERDFFIGLAHMKLKEFDKSSEAFARVKEKKDPNLSPTAAFYSGVIEFQKENFEIAKSNFEFVLDNSKDPKLDEQSESYIEQIAAAQEFKKQKEKRFTATLNLGLMYDSNILNAATANDATGLAGYRGIYGGTLEYRALFTQTNEISPIISYTDMYSTNTSFGAEKTFQNTDPISMSIAVPWKRKGMLFGKPAQSGVSLSWETLRLNADATGERETISHSYVLKTDATFVNSENYFANYWIEGRRDVSTIEVTTPATAQTASKISVGTSQTFFQDKKKTKAWIIDSTLANNAAEGSDMKFNRVDLGGTYLFPWIFGGTWTTRLGGALVKYPDHSASRADTNTSLTVGMTRPLWKNVTGIFSAGYTNNASNVSTSAYNKMTFLSMLSWSGVF